MFSELAQKLNLTASLSQNIRSNRLNKEGDFWFFHTREGVEVGPFITRSDAQYALLYFTEQAEWPDEDQLSTFKSGCEMNSGQEEESTTNLEH
ncbi:MAG: hypothetical protein HRU20_12770 [Pseudomonadales bacterium]|nr:hypothetical protein [Pseudomonadales bacterium]